MVKIIADSTCDLSKELIEKYDISIIPLHILLGEQEYEDGNNILEATKIAAEYNSMYFIDLMNDDIRLFAVNKSRTSGHTSLQRIQVTKELMDSGYSLSRLWTEGRLGGVPNL